MRNIMDRLLAVQKLQFTAGPKVVGLEKLRAEIPAPILARFDRFGARGKNGVALVRNRVCSECHLRITAGKRACGKAMPASMFVLTMNSRFSAA